MDNWAEIGWQVFEDVEDRRSQLGIELADEKGSEILRFDFRMGVGMGIGMLVLTAAAGGIWVRRKLEKRREETNIKLQFFCRNWRLLYNQHMPSSMTSAISSIKFFKLEELKKATNRFSKGLFIGQGAFGIVYRGTLSDGRIVAVKKSDKVSDDINAHYLNELLMLSHISHRNIVRMLGCCLESDVPMIVYEYMSNGTLSDHIHDAAKSLKFSWEDRIRIVKDIARVVAYLHCCASTDAIYHGDLKPKNILLDENYRIAICDFGISKAVPFDKTHITTSVAGSWGYLDPECIRTGQLTGKSDVYAFGVVVAEIITGQKPRPSGMVGRFCSAMDKGRLIEMLWNVPCDEQMVQIVEVAKLARRCLEPSDRYRPSIEQVVDELRERFTL